jgi:hypothetical protein
MAATLPERVRLIALRLLEAVETADDGRASGLMVDMVEAADTTPPDVRRSVLFIVCNCCLAWSGRQDIFLETNNWCLQSVRNSGIPTYPFDALAVPMKAVQFGHAETVDQTTRLVLDLPRSSAATPWMWVSGTFLLHPSMPAELRRTVMQKQLEAFDWALRNGHPAVLDDWMGFKYWLIEKSAPASERATWCLETAYQIADYAPNFPTAGSRSRAATEAAAYFTKAGRADLAAQAQELAESLAADDPKLRLQIALSSAQSSAAAGKWEDVVKGLEPMMARVAPSGQAVQAAMLRWQAQGNLGKKDEAAGWLTKASDLLEQAKLPASERAGHLMTLAELTADRARKLALLKQAESAATEAGLEPPRERISQQLAELAVATGDLVTAEQALLDVIERLETKREALAFDRVLRQSWFADNLGPYQKLLRVEALRGDPARALWIAEKMRARALTDQLAWQKVDMGVRVRRGAGCWL